MSQQPPTRAMRENPDLDQLKRQAKELLEAYRASSPEAVAEVSSYHRTATPETFALHDAQFVLARSYGFESWPKMKLAVEGVTAARLHEAVEKGELETARELLTRRPEIVNLGRGEMNALHMAVLRRDLAMTKLLLEFEADPDTGIWPMRDATSPYVIARDRGYDEIVDVIRAAREKRGARGQVPTEAMRKLQQAYPSGEEAMVAVLDQHPELAEMCPPTGATMLHQAAGRGALLIMKWLLDHGADVDAGGAGYARQTDIARKMLAGEIDPHLEPNDFSGRTVAEQLLWGGASALSAEIVRMALDHVDWQPDDPRWFWMLWRTVPGHEDYTARQQAECCECFKLILARCGPHHRASDYGQTMLHETVSRDHGVGVQLAAILLDAGSRLDVRDKLLKSTPLGWACRWGRVEMVKLFLARGADPVEADAEPWATPRAWAEKTHRPEIVELLEAARTDRL